MIELNINDIKQLVKNGNIIWTNHVILRLFQRNILEEDVENAILNGEIIESYENDYPYPSCLIFGFDLNNDILHVVCGINNNDSQLWIITAYYPKEDEWENDLKTRKGNV